MTPRIPLRGSGVSVIVDLNSRPSEAQSRDLMQDKADGGPGSLRVRGFCRYRDAGQEGGKPVSGPSVSTSAAMMTAWEKVRASWR